MKKILVIMILIVLSLFLVSCNTFSSDEYEEKSSSTTDESKTTEVSSDNVIEDTTEEVTSEEITTEAFLKHTLRSENPNIQLAIAYRENDGTGMPKRGDPPKNATIIEKNQWLSNKLSLSGKYYGVDGISLLPSALNTTEYENTIDRDAFLQIPVYGADGRVNGLEPISTFGSYVYQKKGNSAFYINGEYGLRVLGTQKNGYITDMYGILVDIAFDTPLESVPLTLGESYMFVKLPEYVDVDESALNGYMSAIRIAILDTPNGYIYKYARLDMSQIEKNDEGYKIKIQITDSDGNPIDDAYIMDLCYYMTPNVAMFIYIDGTVLTNQDVLMSGGHINLGFDICFK